MPQLPDLRATTDRSDDGPGESPAPPGRGAVAHLQPGLCLPAAHCLGSAAAIAGALMLAVQGGWMAYLLGQAILSLAFVHAFVLLHEAGHHTLFRSRGVNRWIGHLAGFVALIPFHAWQRIHARHHRYTGWQDLDATTAPGAPFAAMGW